MVDYEELRRKFKPKTGPVPAKRTKKAVIDAIQREYERKRAELTGGAPVFRKGPLFYIFILVLLGILGSLVLSATHNGIGFGRKNVELRPQKARQSMDALAVALGRFRFHTGRFPETEDGLAVLAFCRPDELRRVKAKYPGWDGPYVHVRNRGGALGDTEAFAKDPWGNAYVYETREEGGNPVLYSKGPNGRAGDDDDVLPEQLDFDLPFRETSWTNHWAPCELRGIVVAPDEATKLKVQEEMKKYD